RRSAGAGDSRTGARSDTARAASGTPRARRSCRPWSGSGPSSRRRSLGTGTECGAEPWPPGPAHPPVPSPRATAGRGRRRRRLEVGCVEIAASRLSLLSGPIQERVGAGQRHEELGEALAFGERLLEHGDGAGVGRLDLPPEEEAERLLHVASARLGARREA